MAADIITNRTLSYQPMDYVFLHWYVGGLSHECTVIGSDRLDTARGEAGGESRGTIPLLGRETRGSPCQTVLLRPPRGSDSGQVVCRASRLDTRVLPTRLYLSSSTRECLEPSRYV